MNIMQVFVPHQVGDWESCSASCGNGVKNRTVSCVDDDGLAVNSTKCVGLQPEHQAYCNDAPCDFCATTDCSSQVCFFCHDLHALASAMATAALPRCTSCCALHALAAAVATAAHPMSTSCHALHALTVAVATAACNLTSSL